MTYVNENRNISRYCLRGKVTKIVLFNLQQYILTPRVVRKQNLKLRQILMFLINHIPFYLELSWVISLESEF